MSSDGVERGAHAPQRCDEIGEAFEGEVLAVERNQDGVGRNQRVQREQPERGRAVDEDRIELVPQRRQESAEALLAVGHRDELDLGAREVPVRGNGEQTVDPGLQDEGVRIGRRVVAGERVVDGARAGRLPSQPDAAREVGLRIHVDEQHLLVRQCQRGREVDGGRGFADAALLVGDGDDAAPHSKLLRCKTLRRFGHLDKCWRVAAGSACKHSRALPRVNSKRRRRDAPSPQAEADASRRHRAIAALFHVELVHDSGHHPKRRRTQKRGRSVFHVERYATRSLLKHDQPTAVCVDQRVRGGPAKWRRNIRRRRRADRAAKPEQLAGRSQEGLQRHESTRFDSDRSDSDEIGPFVEVGPGEELFEPRRLN